MSMHSQQIMPKQLIEVLKKHIHKEKLPDNFLDTVQRFYWPIACDVAASLEHIHHGEIQSPFFLGIQGAQGSGKSTLASFIKLILEQSFSKNCLVLSLDDFYLTKTERQALSRKVHPLLATRGVPGTHDMALLEEVLEKIKSIKSGQTLEITTFDKALDDRAHQREWQTVNEMQDVVILEGWCVGVPAQRDVDLTKPINILEEDEDKHGHWRQYVNEQIKQHYQIVYDQFDGLAMLLAPSFDCVLQWRTKQEQKLIEKRLAENKPLDGVMSAEQIKRFISHYQRLTEHAFQTLPVKADWLLTLRPDHEIAGLVLGKKHARFSF